MPPAVATLIAIRNSQQQSTQSAAAEASHPCGTDAACHVPVMAPSEQVALTQRVAELQAQVHALEVKLAGPHPAVSSPLSAATVDVAIFSFMTVGLGIRYLLVLWWKKRGGSHDS